MKTINLEEILKQHNNLYTKAYAVKDVDGNFNSVIDINGAIDAMKEFGKQLLELAAENAWCNHSFDGAHGCEYNVDKQSILDTINQIK